MATRKSRRTFGAIRKLPSGRYQASYLAPDGQRRIGDSTFPTVADADAFLSNIANAVNRGEWRAPEPARELFGEFAKGWLATGMGRNGKRLSPTTAELYAHLWRKWLEPDFGAVPLHQLTPGKWRTWWATTTAKHPGSTQPAKAYRLARVILNVAVDDGLLTINPCQVKSAGEESSPERPVATEEEVERIAAAMGDAWSPLVLLAAYCSLRFGELAGLRRSSIDLLHRTVTVSEQAVELGSGEIRFKAPKSDSGRVVGHSGGTGAGPRAPPRIGGRPGPGCPCLHLTGWTPPPADEVPGPGGWRLARRAGYPVSTSTT